MPTLGEAKPGAVMDASAAAVAETIAAVILIEAR
jgi:hypothetical protein